MKNERLSSILVATLIRSVSLTGCVSLAIAALPAHAIFDGFGDADRNNNGGITPYDTDVNLNGSIDGGEVSSALDPNDVGIQWVATRGFTQPGDPKANIKIIDDSTGDSDSPGLQSGYALAYDSKGRGSSTVGMFVDPITIGANVGDKVLAEFDIRVWTKAVFTNDPPTPLSAELRWGLFQDTDNQFGQSNSVGPGSPSFPPVPPASIVWGHDPANGENDGEWREANPGPVGDKGIWSRIPIGTSGTFGVDPNSAQISYENNSNRFLEGIPSTDGCCDFVTVASPTADGPGGAIIDTLLNLHTLRLEIIRTTSSVEVVSFIDGVEILRNEVDQSNPDVQALGSPPESFDYIALRNAGFDDMDLVIDNVRVLSMPVPEPGNFVLLSISAFGALARRRRRVDSWFSP